MSNQRWAASALALGLAIVGCAAELDKSQDYSWGYADSQGGSGNGGSGNPEGGATNPQGGSSNPQGGSNNVPPDPTCLTSIMNAQCKGCHYSGSPEALGKGLDLGSANVGQRLLNKDSTCGDGKIVDPSNKTNSAILKRVSGQKTGCNGQAMPSGTGLSGDDLQCFKDWINSF